MARKPPSYRQHKPSGQAFVQHKGQRHYLGRWGTPESHERYHRALRQIAENDAIDRASLDGVVTLGSLAKAFIAGVQSPTDVKHFEYALGFVIERCGDLPPDEFRASHLKAVREAMVAAGWSRGYVNRQTGRIRAFFRRLVEDEHVSPDRLAVLEAVRPLLKGRTAAKESKKITPVAWETVERTLPFLSPPVAAMVRVQFWCAMRPTEACIMRPCDVDQSGDVWLYRPAAHKGEWRGRALVKAIPGVVQDDLRPWLDRDPESYCFSPIEAVAWINEHRPPGEGTRKGEGGERKTKIYPSELRARAKRKARTKRRNRSRLSDHYDRASYRRAISYAVRRAAREGVEIERWTPLQLRHGIATLVSHSLGEQSAQILCGHSKLDTTAIYAERTIEELVSVASRLDRFLRSPPDGK